MLAIACIRRLTLTPSRAAGQSQLAVLLLIVLPVMSASACMAYGNALRDVCNSMARTGGLLRSMILRKTARQGLVESITVWQNDVQRWRTARAVIGIPDFRSLQIPLRAEFEMSAKPAAVLLGKSLFECELFPNGTACCVPRKLS